MSKLKKPLLMQRTRSKKSFSLLAFYLSRNIYANMSLLSLSSTITEAKEREPGIEVDIYPPVDVRETCQGSQKGGRGEGGGRNLIWMNSPSRRGIDSPKNMIINLSTASTLTSHLSVVWEHSNVLFPCAIVILISKYFPRTLNLINESIFLAR